MRKPFRVSIQFKPSLPRLTKRFGRSTPAFIMSISAVPPANGRAPSSSRSDRASPRLAG
jgi:hypothetical protein